MNQQRILNIAATLIFLAGLASALVVLLIHIPTEHPFNGPDGYADEFGMTKAEVEAVNPHMAEWMIHVSDQVGSASLGWGLFLMSLAVLGIRKGHKVAWWALWIGATPTAAYSAFGEYVMFGTFDAGSLSSLAVLLVFLIGMLLPLGVFRRLRQPDPVRQPPAAT